MCGIVGAVAQRNVVPILLEGLQRLEYRGYDSCGLAVWNGALQVVRTTERVTNLALQTRAQEVAGTVGIAHTRWATHGSPSEENAHPLTSGSEIVVVHNGIIENYEPLRQHLKTLGYTFTSETDTEVIAHLVHYYYHTQAERDLCRAVLSVTQKLQGSYAIAVMATSNPEQIIGARQGSPLVVGLGVEEHFLASDAFALLPVTQKIIYLEDGDVVRIHRLTHQIYTRSGPEAMPQPVKRPCQIIQSGAQGNDLGTYRHYMQKEIFDQPHAIADTLESIDGFYPELFGPNAPEIFAQIDSVLILACGSSYHAGLVAKHWLEAIAKMPTQVEIASEYRYRDSVPRPKQLVVCISQSGETADVLRAREHALNLGQPYQLAICNVPTSTLVRQSSLVFLTRAGIEVGVASTKAFTSQLLALGLLTFTLAKIHNQLNLELERSTVSALRHLPTQIGRILALEPQIMAWAEQIATKQHALFLGRGVYFPVAAEGALKLKEISYIHAEAYPAGELKHGPLALVDKEMPVIAIAPQDGLVEKIKSNLHEVRARGGELFVLVGPEVPIEAEEGVHLLRLPEATGVLAPILYAIPLQLLAYYAALQKGTDVDKPRNLAKSVTVE